jgi:PTH1 family peptidyl-tRNA hydrolase
MKESKFSGEISRISSDGINCRLLKPQTFMNESGRSVLSVINYYKIEPEEVLVVHDEIDFEPGKVRLKNGGGHAGHNGLRDIISRIGSKNFLRLRIGVGHPGHKEKVVGSVLGRPSKMDQGLIDSSIDQALDIMPQLFDGNIHQAMTELHTINEPGSE